MSAGIAGFLIGVFTGDTVTAIVITVLIAERDK